jgi:PAS domain S-box-containing protein
MSSLNDGWTQLWRGSRAGDPFAEAPLRKTPYLVVALFIAIAHLASSWFGYLLLSGGVAVTPVFPEAGLDLVIVLVFGTRCWPVLLAAYFATSLWRHTPWLASCGVAAASLLRTMIAVLLVRWVSGMKNRLGHFEDLVGIAVAGAIAPGLEAAFGTACLVLGGRFPASQWATVLSRWWVADALGILTVTPVLIVVARSLAGHRPKHGPWFPVQVLLYLVVVSAASYFVFFRPDASSLLFTVFLLILMAAAWLGPTTARVTALVIASSAIWATHNGFGVFAGGTMRENLENLDLFLAAVSLTGMALGAFRLAGNLILPSGILLAGWALSGLLYASMDRDRTGYDQARFDRIISSIEVRIANRFSAYQDALWGAAGHLTASGRISPQDWHVYVSRLGLLDRYPGTTLLAIVQPVPRDQAAAFSESHRKTEWPGFNIRSAPRSSEPAAEHFVIVCAEPPAVAVRAVGDDLATDDRRKAAAEQARDSGAPVLARNTEMRDGSGKGLQLFVPVYREGAILATVPDRRKAFVAWVSVVFSADTFFRSSFPELQNMVSLRVFDGTQASSQNLFFASTRNSPPGGLFERRTQMTLGGEPWALDWNRRPGFPSITKTPQAWVAGSTSLLSLLLAGLVTILQTAGRRTADRLKLVQSALALGTWEINLESRKVRCSGQLLQLYGIQEPREQLDLDEWLARVHPDERERRIADAVPSQDDSDPIDRQYRAVWPDGSVHWLHSKALVVFDERGRATQVIGVDFDITDDKRNEERIRVLSSAVEQSPVSIVITDLRNRIEYANPRLIEATGYTLDELKGRDSRILVARDAPPQGFQEVARSLETGGWKGLMRIGRKDGSVISAATSIQWIRDASGARTHQLIVAVDISERLEMEAALKLSEERFRIAAESSGDSIYEWDLHTDAVAVLGGNRIQPETDGWTLPKGKEFRALLHPADREPIEAAIRRHLDEGLPYSQEYRIVAPNGEIRYYSDTGSALRDDHGQPYKWIGVCKDITERKRVERANAELAKIVECADTAIISKDLNGNVLTWNRGAESMYGYPAGEMIGRNITSLLPPDRASEEHSLIERLLRGETIEHFETVRVTKSGKPIDVLLTVSPIRDHAGKLIGAAHVAWDVTQIKQLQAQLAQAQKLESVGQLAAGIAHEINTPIQYIGDNGKFLEDAFRDLIRFADTHVRPALDLPDSVKAMLPAGNGDLVEEGLLEYLRLEIPRAITQLLEGVDHVARIVRAMKEFSHPGPIEKTPVDINRAIESTILVSRSEWKYVTEVTTDFDPELPPVRCVPGEFNQVILNLIVNSAHAIADVVSDSGNKGTIHISTRHNGAMAEIRVSDTGGGIPETIRSRIFDPFFTTKPVGKGTGQGLAIAHAVIVQKHQGALKVESEPGRGTTFIIELPLECEVELV